MNLYHFTYERSQYIIFLDVVQVKKSSPDFPISKNNNIQLQNYLKTRKKNLYYKYNPIHVLWINMV